MPIVELSALKSHLRIDGSDDDTLLNTYLDAGQDYVQHLLGRSLETSEQETLVVACRPGQVIFEVLIDGLLSVDAFVYVDEDGTERTLAATEYHLEAPTYNYARVRLDDVLQQVDSTRSDAVRITVSHGSASPSNAVKLAVTIVAASMYENPMEGVDNKTLNAVNNLLNTDRSYRK